MNSRIVGVIVVGCAVSLAPFASAGSADGQLRSLMASVNAGLEADGQQGRADQHGQRTHAGGLHGMPPVENGL